MRESALEARLVREVKKRGGLCYKFVSPGAVGVPDRIVILPGGRVVFAELKADTGSPSECQKWQIRELRKRGADVRVLKGLDQVLEFLKEVDVGGT